MYRQRENYSIDDIILAEYGTTVVGLEMLRSVSEEVEQERRKKESLIPRSVHNPSQNTKQ